MGEVQVNKSQEPKEEIINEEIQIPEWLSGIEGVEDLPGEILGDPSLKPMTNIPGLLKSYVNAQKMVGADRLVIPGADAPEEDWKAFYQKAGVPAEYEEYGVKAPETEDEAAKGYFDDFLKQAHEAGLLPKQAQKLADFQAKYAADSAAEAQAKFEEAIEQQIEDFKKAEGDKYNDTVYGAKLVLNQFDDDGAFTKLVEEDPTFGNNPHLIRFLAKISGHLTEDTFRENAVSNIGTSAEEAQQKLNGIMGDSDGPYWRKEHPDHNRVVKEVNKLMNLVMQG
jgi:hypothetical protein